MTIRREIGKIEQPAGGKDRRDRQRAKVENRADRD